MKIAVELVSTAAIVFVVHIFLYGFFETGKRPEWVWAAMYLGYGVGLFLLGRAAEFAAARLLFNLVMPVILALVLFEARVLSAVFAGMSAFGIFALAEILMIGILDVAGIEAETLMLWEGTQHMVSIGSQLVSLMLALLVSAMIRRKRTAVTLPFVLMLLPGGILGIWLACEMGRLLVQGETIQPLPFILAAIGLIYMNILLVFYAERVKAAADRQREQELAEHHYAMQERYYEQLRLEQNETRAVFHDINKYLGAMRALTGAGQTEQAAKVLEEAQRLTDAIGNTVDVGNPVVSAILNEYLQTAEEKRIDFDFDVSVPEALPVSAVDLYILLGNTLDNAIDACCALPETERYIRLQLRQVQDMLFYCLKNPCDPNAPERKDKLHGFGLKSVARCAEKYRGNVTVSSKDGFFEVAAHLNIQGELQ